MALKKVAEFIEAWRNVIGWCRFLSALVGARRTSGDGGKKAAALAGLFALALIVGGCGGPAEGPVDTMAPPDSTGEPAPDAHMPATGPDAGPASMPDARPSTPGPDTGHDSTALEADGGADAGRTVVDPDAGNAAPGADGAAAVAPICPDPSNASCRAALQADSEIRSTFPDSCDGLPYRQCGGVIEDGHIVVTYPMTCVFGTWRLAAGWYSNSVVYAYECSRGCGAAGVMCAP